MMFALVYIWKRGGLSSLSLSLSLSLTLSLALLNSQGSVLRSPVMYFRWKDKTKPAPSSCM